uniref:Uncharacterized protein n=1 Tax=Nonomuraea gerenzanensis TaxID=93944 RepID=A0A1M4ED67_9ACTN|nr:hypothetical protein BN4615_P6447 [Nonomuraea gerenzanensis]
MLFGGTNPQFGKALAYLPERATGPIVCCHLWNGRPARDEPVLLAIRTGRGAFKDTFTFTPEGTRHRHPA